MKALLFLLIVAAGGGAGYEFYLQQQNTADFLSKRATFQAQADKLTAEHRKLAAEKDQDVQDLAAIHQQAADLQGQIHGVAQVTAPAGAATNAAPAAAH